MNDNASSRRLLGPFNRVEGDLEIQLEVDQGKVSKAWVNSPLFRGYEQILHGKDPMDALVYTPRICGICSVSQSVAAARSLADAMGLTASRNGQLATNLILAAENLADHLTHFYLFFMPDFARQQYRDLATFDATEKRFKAQLGSAAKQVLPARADFLHLTGILAGKWPHSLAIQPGGTTRSIDRAERIRLVSIIRDFRNFLEQTLFGAPLEQVAELDSHEALWQLADKTPDSDFSHFLRLSDRLDLHTLGRATDQFLSYGAYASTSTTGQQHLFASGYWTDSVHQLDTSTITEDLSHSWLKSQSQPKHPFQGSTIPDTDIESGYSWCKAPRLDHQIMEVGALARQMVNGHALIRELVSGSGGNVQNRVIARLLELALVVPQMETWVMQLQPGQEFCNQSTPLEEAQGLGLVEAARGSLGHWVRVHNGRIINYQIIAPTTWNFSPRDADGNPGALELALQDTPCEDDPEHNVSIQHIIRSFDPCMVCTVH